MKEGTQEPEPSRERARSHLRKFQVAASRSTLPALQGVKFDKLAATATDLDQHLSMAYPAGVRAPRPFLVPLDTLHRIASRSRGDINLEPKSEVVRIEYPVEKPGGVFRNADVTQGHPLASHR